jgi:hypothetical protein
MDYLIYFVDSDRKDRKEPITAKDVEDAERKLRKKFWSKIYYMWKIEEVHKKGNKKVFP